MINATDAFIRMVNQDYGTQQRLAAIDVAINRYITSGKLYIGSASPIVVKALKKLGYKVRYNGKFEGYTIYWK